MQKRTHTDGSSGKDVIAIICNVKSFTDNN